MRPDDAPVPAGLSVKRRTLRFAVLALVAAGVAMGYESGAAFSVGGSLVGILAIQPIIGLSLALQGVRHALLVRMPMAPLKPCIRAVVMSAGLNMLFPARIAELVAATYLRDKLAISFSDGLAAVFIARMIDILLLAMISAAAIFLTLTDGGGRLAIAAAALVLGVAFLIVRTRCGHFAANLLRHLSWHGLADFVESFFTSTAARIRHWQAWAALGLTVVMWTLAWLGVYVFIVLVLDMEATPTQGLVVLVMSTLGAAVPALPASLGTYEAGAVAGLMMVGVAFEQAVPVAILLHVSQTVLALGAALVSASTERTGISSLIAEARARLRNPRD